MAWWVVLGHALQLSGFWSVKEIGDYFDAAYWPHILLAKILGFAVHTESAVNVFIILSGFVITHLLLTKKEPYLDFISRRFFRLAPALYVALGLAILVVSLYKVAYTGLPFSGDTSMRLQRLAEQDSNFILHLVNHLLLIHSFFPQELIPYSPTTFLAPAWSISLEWQFYLIAPLLLFILLRSQTSLVLVIVSLVCIRFATHHLIDLHWQFNSFFFKACDYFLVGILSRLIIERLYNGKQFVDLLILLAGLMLLQDKYSTFIWLFVLGVIFYEMGYLNIDSGKFRGLLNILFFNDGITNIGKWSYSTYLIHIPIFTICVGGYASFTDPLGLTQKLTFFILLAMFPVILLVSRIMYQYVEQPSMDFISARIKRKQLRHAAS